MMRSFHCPNLVRIGCNIDFLSRFQYSVIGVTKIKGPVGKVLIRLLLTSLAFSRVCSTNLLYLGCKGVHCKSGDNRSQKLGLHNVKAREGACRGWSKVVGTGLNKAVQFKMEGLDPYKRVISALKNATVPIAGLVHTS